MLQNSIPTWKTSTLAQRLEDCRLLLSIHGFLRPSESDRIQRAITRAWNTELNIGKHSHRSKS